MLDQLLAGIHLSPLSTWVIASFLLYACVTNLLWLARDHTALRLPYGLAEAGRFAYYLAIPYLVLGGWPRQPYQGLLSPGDLGLVSLDGAWPVTRWLEAVGSGLGAALIVLPLLIVARRSANRIPGAACLCFGQKPWWALCIDVLYLQVHWAFYWGAMTLARQDVYAGIFWGLGLVSAEWLLNPWWRESWRRPHGAASTWLHATMALVAALLFLLTRNLYVSIGAHALLLLALRLSDPRPAPAAVVLEPGPEYLSEGDGLPAGIGD